MSELYFITPESDYEWSFSLIPSIMFSSCESGNFKEIAFLWLFWGIGYRVYYL